MSDLLGPIAEPDFVTKDGRSHCRFCGALKEASAKFFIEHYHECVKPRTEEKKA